MQFIIKCAAVAACATPFLVLAAESDIGPSGEANSLDQIIVTGARTPIDTARLGSATTIITGDQIRSRQQRYVSDFLRTVPGFAVSQTGVLGTQTQVRVRGSEANHVLVLIDGVRANDPATGDEFRWEHLGTGNVERIEIIRGPQSALWGSEAVGAVVNVITRSDRSNSTLNAYSEFGENNTTNLGLSGSANVADWQFGIGYDDQETDGQNISRTGDERDGAELSTGTLSARYRASSQFELNAGLRVVDASTDTDPVDFFVTGLPVDGDNRTDSDNVVGRLSASWVPGNGRISYRARAAYYDSEHKNFADSAETSATSSERVTFGLQSDLRLGDNLLSLALEREDTDFRQRGEVGFGDPNQDQSIDVTSVIAEYQHLQLERLTWILGARYDDNSDFGDAVSGRASMAYQLAERTLLRASIGTAYKTPTFTERFGFFPEQFIGNPDLDPETSVSYDLGIEQRLLDDALTVQLSLYRQDLTDEINGFVFDPETFLSTAENLSGNSRRSGVEFAANWQATAALSFAAMYTYADADEEDANGQRVSELRRPRHSGSLSLNLAPPEGRVQFSLVADYGGDRKDVFFPPFPDPSEVVTLDSYWLVDANLQYRIADSFTFFVRGQNLLDEDYEQVFGYRTLGRTGYAGIRITFGGET